MSILTYYLPFVSRKSFFASFNHLNLALPNFHQRFGLLSGIFLAMCV
jgi:hypothetical protein